MCYEQALTDLDMVQQSELYVRQLYNFKCFTDLDTVRQNESYARHNYRILSTIFSTI